MSESFGPHGQLGGEPELSLVVPAYNEKARLAQTLAELVIQMDRHYDRYEVIVVDDGSQDGTAALAYRLAKTNPKIKLLSLAHRGKGHAVRSGVLAARGRYVAFCDADLPVPASDLVRIISRLVDVPVAIGSRELPDAVRIGEPRLRHFMGRFFNYLVRLLVLPGLQDTQCGAKAFTAECALAVFSRQVIDGFGFDVEVLYLAKRYGYAISEVPVTWSYGALSRVDPFRDSLRMLGDVLRVRWQDLSGRYDWTATPIRRRGVAGGTQS